MSRVGGTDGVVTGDDPEEGAVSDTEATVDDGDATEPTPVPPPAASGVTTPDVARRLDTDGDGNAEGDTDAADEDMDADEDDADGDTDRDGDETGRDRRRTLLAVGGITAVLAVPLVVAVIAVRTPPWYPLVDLAQIEMRVRDVGTSHPPMTGLGGRIFGLNTQGSHPGPFSFYLLAPIYRLLGGSPWALQVSAASLNVAALAGTIWATHRRWGLRGALLMAAGLALLMRMYGTVILLYPWNPYMPVLFWTLFLVCVWGVLCRDLVLLPFAVAAGCLCAQTHIPYLGPVGGLGGLVIVGLIWQYRQARGDAAERRRVVCWTGGALALGLALWAPVFIEQIGGDPGNVSVLLDSFRHPTDNPVGLAEAWRLLTGHLNPFRLVEADRTPHPAGWPGIAVLVVWAASVAVAARLRDRTLATLHLVVAAALLLGLITISRIFGATWFYLTLWAFGTATLVLVAIAATAALAARAALAGRDDADRFAGLDRMSLAAAGIAVLVPVALLTRTAPDTADVDADESNQLAAVIAPTVGAIDDGVVRGGADGTFLVTWADPVNLGGQGLGLMLELERQGYDARAGTHEVVSAREHRIVSPGEADAEIHVAVGVANIERARSHPGSAEVAIDDPRTSEQIETYARLRDRVIDRLVAAGQDALVPQVDGNIFGLAAHKDLPESAVEPLYIMGSMPQPIGVFTWDPTT